MAYGGRFGGRDGRGPPPYAWDGGRDQGGRGGRFDGGRGRGGGGGHAARPNRPSEIRVMVNYHKIELLNPSKSITLTQYVVDIRRGRFNKETRKPMVDPKKENDPLDLNTSSGISRRILNQLSNELLQSRRLSSRLLSDGERSAYYLEHFLKDENGQTVDEETFGVKINVECEDYEDHANQCKHAWFIVKLTKVGQVSLSSSSHESKKNESSRQFLDVLLKSGMLMAGMKAFGRSPRVFYFPPEESANMWNTTELMNQYRNRNRNFYQPIMGLLNSVKMCVHNNDYSYFVKSSAKIDYAWPPIKVLDPTSRKIGSVDISDVHSYIMDARKREEVHKLLSQVMLKVEYVTNFDSEHEQKLRNEGLSQDQIEKKRIRTRRYKKLTKDPEYDADIIWKADDLNEFKVDTVDRVTGESIKYTATEYFKNAHGIIIRYPKIPLVCVGKCRNGKFYEWYPLELVFMEFKKINGANKVEQVTAKLDFYSNNGGKALVEKQQDLFERAMSLCIDKVGALGITPDHILEQYNLIRSDPVKFTAKVLKEPCIDFGNSSAKVSNGSWSVANRGNYNSFTDPAELQSFAYVDFSGKDNSFLRDFFEVASKHNMKIPSIELIDACKVEGNARRHDKEFVHQMIERAILRAKAVFLGDSSDYFSRNKTFFRTRARDHKGFQYPCLILDWFEEIKRAALILPADVKFPSHYFNHQGETIFVRMMVKIYETEALIDPFDFYFDTNGFKARINNEIMPVNFEKYCYVQKKDGRDHILYDEDFENSKLYYETYAPDDKIDCPTILFAIMEEGKGKKDKTDKCYDEGYPTPMLDKYPYIKFLCLYKYGIQSQCIGWSQYNMQGRKEQYCSNVAIKVNAKLANKFADANAWEIKKLPWVNDVPTVVMGISRSNQKVGHGEDSKSIIVGSICLDQKLMRIAHDVRLCTRSDKDYIDAKILVDLTTSILAQYYAVHKKVPSRMLIYREGVNEFSCDNVVEFEIKAIREGCHNFRKNVLNQDMSCSCHAGCNWCCPLITFVACLMNTNVKIVPQDPERDGVRRGQNGVVNVPSGVCVDDHIVDPPLPCVTEEPNLDRMKLNNPNGITLFAEPSGGYDFILVAHGSGLGTSKPVYFRVLLNENAVYKPRGDCTPLSRDALQNLTYQMCFLYSTASKAIRLVPVVYYGSRLANIISNMIPYLNQDEMVPENIDADDIAREEVDQNDENRSQRRRRNNDWDNTSSIRKIFKRKEVTEQTPYYMKHSILHHFAVNGMLDTGGRVLLVEPFTTHISA